MRRRPTRASAPSITEPFLVPAGATPKTVASLPLPPGIWDVVARAKLTGKPGTAGIPSKVWCRLVGGRETDRTDLAYNDVLDVSLDLVHKFAGSHRGVAKLQCAWKKASPSATLVATEVRIEATEVRTLTKVNMGTGSTSHLGSGQPPVMFAGARRGPKPVDTTGLSSTLSILTVPTGHWIAWAKVDLRNADPGAGNRGTFCSLSSTVGQEKGSFTLAPHATEMAVTLSGQTFVPKNDTAAIELGCSADGSAGQVVATNIVITALRTGHLRQVDLSTDSTVTSGRPGSVPDVVHGYRDSSVGVHGGNGLRTVARMNLPKGNWAVRAKALLTDVSTHARKAECRLVVGSKSDISTRMLEPSPDMSTDTVFLETPASLSSPGSAALRCSNGGATGDVEADQIRITAVRASSISDRAA